MANDQITRLLSNSQFWILYNIKFLCLVQLSVITVSVKKLTDKMRLI